MQLLVQSNFKYIGSALKIRNCFELKVQPILLNLICVSVVFWRQIKTPKQKLYLRESLIYGSQTLGKVVNEL